MDEKDIIKLLEICKTQLRFELSDSDVDNEIVSLIYSAIDFLKNAGVEFSDSHLYKRAVAILVANFYENRLGDGRDSKAISIGLNSIITQLNISQRSEKHGSR